MSRGIKEVLDGHGLHDYLKKKMKKKVVSVAPEKDMLDAFIYHVTLSTSYNGIN